MSKWPTPLVIVPLALCLFYGGYRAVRLAITNDENATVAVTHYTYGQILAGSYKAGSYKEAVLPKDVVSLHFLATLLAKPCVQLLPVDEVTAARIPALLGLALYCWGVWRVVRLFPSPVSQVVIAVVLLSNSYLLDFFSIARGYGLAIGLTMLSLSYLPKAPAVWIAALTPLAHTCFVVFYIAILATIAWLGRRRVRIWVHCLLSTCLMGALYLFWEYKKQWSSAFPHRLPADKPLAVSMMNCLLGLGERDPLCRYMLYLFPMAVVCLGLLATRPRRKLPRLAGWSALVLVSLSGLRGINLTHAQAWRECADVPSVLSALRQVHEQTGGDVMLATSSSKWTVWYYAEHLLGLKLHPWPSEVDLSFLRSYDWLTVYEWKISQTNFHLPPDNPLLPGTTHVLLSMLNRDDQCLLATPPPGGLAQLHFYPASDTTLEMLIAPQHAGAVTFPDGRKYVGEFRRGAANGQGTVVWPNGQKYIGEFRDGTADGQGTARWADGRVQVGRFRNDKAQGQGTCTWPDGRKYMGEFKDGMFHGQGTFTWPDGQTYVGEFREGQFDGTGKLTYPDGRVEDGLWKQGQFQGALH
ncbi:MAG TPA: MORN repeat-containing protein [Verrucomicrobiae bacterium]|nr:MORN repeat-containing protein [Verrucomicrobiae bacterium]